MYAIRSYYVRRSEVYRGFPTVLAGFDLVRDALVAIERHHAGGLDRADVNEAVFTSYNFV